MRGFMREVHRQWKFSSMEEKGALLIVFALVTAFLAWTTHIGWVVVKLSSDGGVTGGQIALGLIGAVVFPIGIVHGYIIWVVALIWCLVGLLDILGWCIVYFVLGIAHLVHYLGV